MASSVDDTRFRRAAAAVKASSASTKARA